MKNRRGRGGFSAIVSYLITKLKQLFIGLLSLWIAAIFLFSFLPVPYSAVMLQKQLSAWIGGDFSYRASQTWVSMDDISPYMALAVMASEDQKFPEHWGFDIEAISSVIGSGSRGASTISQQTAKNLFLWNGRSWARKGLEAGLTVGLETVWTKRRILTVYLNVAEFGDGIFGVEQAARHFFSKSAKQLTAEEAALLAAVLPNPIRYKANRPSAYLLSRQKWILRQMRQMGGVSVVNNL
jgi:monofunctional biosynthetic peptidoglycan transglycosylase